MSKAIGENISSRQRLVDQKSEKQAIIPSKRERAKVPLVIDSKTTLMVDLGCDMELKRVNYLRRYENPKTI